ncbi:MAG: response regulator [Sulfuricurvum sp.]|nr:response regulator [Sulfuricurvum sp.]MDD5387667.1 response regulator [Sulfuricurvum sp.]
MKLSGANLSSIKILIVEDEAIVSMEIKRVIERIGYEVSAIVTNYKDAIQSVKRNKPDLILMDINLNSYKDGIETVQEIKMTQDIPVIYLTADSDSKTIERAIQTDPVGYLQKPFKREDLNSTIALGLYKNKVDKNDIVVDNRLTEIGAGYYYDVEYELLYYKNEPIKLSPKEKILLTKLVQAWGDIVPFKTLEKLIWGHPVDAGSYRTLLYRLRGKLHYELIETIPSFGLKLKV